MTMLFNTLLTLSLLAVLPPVFPECVPINKFSGKLKEFEIFQVKFGFF